MAKETLDTLSEPMFYLLLALQEERPGNEISQYVTELTAGQVTLPPGTLYSLLSRFVDDQFIYVSNMIGKRKYYSLTPLGKQRLEEEVRRLEKQLGHYRAIAGQEKGDFQ